MEEYIERTNMELDMSYRLFCINVLGEIYKVKFCGADEEKQLEEADGFCDTTTKTICIKNDYVPAPDQVKNIPEYAEKVLRHEIIHAFMYESGLSVNCDWAVNEAVIDWFAIQFPKIKRILNEIMGIEEVCQN